MRGGGLPYRPAGRGFRGEHGVTPLDDALSAGVCRSGHHMVVPALQDRTPDLWQGLVAAYRWGGEVFVGGAEAGGTEGGVPVGCGGLSHWSGWFGSAGWSFSAGARRTRMVPLCVTCLKVFCVSTWPQSMRGIEMCWCRVCWRALQRTRSAMASWWPCTGVARSLRALTVSLALGSYHYELSDCSSDADSIKAENNVSVFNRP